MFNLTEIFQSPVFSWLPPHHLRQSLRAKRLQMRISYRKGLEIILPRRFARNDARAFVESKRDWIEKQYARLTASPPAEVSPLPPAEISLRLLNENWTICYLNTANKKKLSLKENPDNILSITGAIDSQDSHKIYSLLTKWLKKKAYDILPFQLQKISRETGLIYHKVTIRNQKTLWGSCNIKKNINLSLSLLFLPPHLVNYVLIHELCHTVHLNHSVRFWKLVSRYDPHYRQHAAETREGKDYIPPYFK
jgi:predicted metal-dependent hydrolase